MKKSPMKTILFALALCVAGGTVAIQAGEGHKKDYAKKDATHEAAATHEHGAEGECCGSCGGEKMAADASDSSSMIKEASATESAGPYTLGSEVANFSLKHAQSGETKSLKELAGKQATVLVFWNQQCPYVVECHGRVGEFAKKYKDKGVSVIAIDAGVNNDPGSIAKHANELPFPVLINQESDIAAKFAATRTPEVFILDENMVVMYHGAFDSGKADSPEDRSNYVETAVTEILAGQEPSTKKTEAFGCGLKYAKGVKPIAG